MNGTLERALQEFATADFEFFMHLRGVSYWNPDQTTEAARDQRDALVQEVNALTARIREQEALHSFLNEGYYEAVSSVVESMTHRLRMLFGAVHTALTRQSITSMAFEYEKNTNGSMDNSRLQRVTLQALAQRYPGVKPADLHLHADALFRARAIRETTYQWLLKNLPSGNGEVH